MACIIQSQKHTADMTSVLTILQTFKQRQDVLAQQSYISEYASEWEEMEEKKKAAEEEERNMIAVHPKLYDTLEWQCFVNDEDDELISPSEDISPPEAYYQDKWTQLEDELYDMIYELNYERRDYAFDPKQREYLRSRIQEKLSTFKDLT